MFKIEKISNNHNNNTSFFENLNQYMNPKDKPKYEENHIIIKIKFFLFLWGYFISESKRQNEYFEAPYIDIQHEADKINSFLFINILYIKRPIIFHNLADILRQIFILSKL